MAGVVRERDQAEPDLAGLTPEELEALGRLAAIDKETDAATVSLVLSLFETGGKLQGNAISVVLKEDGQHVTLHPGAVPFERYCP